jgi:CheY-like chemotaxis protein
MEMTSMQLDEYWKKLYEFIDDYPILEESLKKYLAERNYKDFFIGLSTLRDILTGIHAADMAQEIQSQISLNTKYENIRHEKLEAFMSYFLASVSILSIDIQKVELLSLDDEKHKVVYTDLKKSGKYKTILAVDDNPVHLNALRAHLQDEPYKLMCLSSGEDALRYIEKNQPNLYILDIMMPGMDGIELAQRIINVIPTATIIFLTGSSSRDIVLEAINAGASDFIVKPAIKENVLARIEKFI